MSVKHVASILLLVAAVSADARPKIGVALGGGGARGAAHIGVLRVLEEASQMSMFFLFPFVFLSGFVFPIAGMPKIFQWISAVVPAKYFVEVIRGIVLRGANLIDLWRPTALLATYTFLIIALAMSRFRKTTA